MGEMGVHGRRYGGRRGGLGRREEEEGGGGGGGGGLLVTRFRSLLRDPSLFPQVAGDRRTIGFSRGKNPEGGVPIKC